MYQNITTIVIKLIFLKGLELVVIFDKIDLVFFSEFSDIFRKKLYKHRKKPGSLNTISISPSGDNWPKLRIYSKSKGLTVQGFSFSFLNTSRRLEIALEPGTNLLDDEGGWLKASSFLDKNDFYSHQKEIAELVEGYKIFQENTL